MKLTEVQKTSYLNNPAVCPYCGSADIAQDDCDESDKHMWKLVDWECYACQNVWTARYTLTSVTDFYLAKVSKEATNENT